MIPSLRQPYLKILKPVRWEEVDILEMWALPTPANEYQESTEKFQSSSKGSGGTLNI
jgi:hypothetical protein